MNTKNLNKAFGITPALTSLVPAVSSKRPRKSIKTEWPMPVEARTEVTARVDVGFGNTLSIRGQGGGLSWERSTPLQCRNGSTWVWTTMYATEKVIFKLLLNDSVWARGEDIVVDAGKQIEVVPQF